MRKQAESLISIGAEPVSGQTNICLATQPNVIANVSNEQLQVEFASLASATPSATAWLEFDATAFAAAAASTSSSSVSSTTATISTTPSSATPPAASTPSTKSHNHTNGGAIGGAVVAGVVGLSLIAALLYFLLRKRRTNRRLKSDTSPHTAFAPKAGEGYYDAIQEHRPQYMMAEMEGPRRDPSELAAGIDPQELDGSAPGELPGSTPVKPGVWR